MKKIILIIGVIIIFILLFAILQKINETENNSSNLIGYWNLIDFSEDSNNVGMIPQDIKSANIIFEETLASGTSFCNNYSGEYTTSGTDIIFSAFAVTRKLCGENIDKLENTYFQELNNTTSFSIKGDNLFFYDENGSQVLAFKKRPQLTVEETNWNVLGYNNGKGGIVSLYINSTISAKFENNIVAGNSGCNSYSSSYVIKDSNIKIDLPAVTLLVCTQELMEQEKQYLIALQNSTVYDITFDGLELRDGNGSLQVTMIPE